MYTPLAASYIVSTGLDGVKRELSLAAPVFALFNLQFTVIKSFNTVIILLARPMFMVSDME